MRKLLVISLLAMALALPLLAQEAGGTECGGDELARQRDTLAAFLVSDFAADMPGALANLFRLGALYQSLALDCGYAPNEAEIGRMLEQTLRLVSLEELIAAQAVGADVEAILLELDRTLWRSAAGSAALQWLGAGLGRRCAGLRGLP